jgi:hypothetical protein
MEPPSKKSRKLLDDENSSDSGDESGGVPISNEPDEFKVNEDYARRFEHNKKREEVQQCMYAFLCLPSNSNFRDSGSKTRQELQSWKAP